MARPAAEVCRSKLLDDADAEDGRRSLWLRSDHARFGDRLCGSYVAESRDGYGTTGLQVKMAEADVRD